MPDVGLELGTACMPSGHASDRATAPGDQHEVMIESLYLIEYHKRTINSNINNEYYNDNNYYVIIVSLYNFEL